MNMKVKDSLAAAHQVTISAQLEECLLIDPGELLLGNWDLYVAIFDRLTRGPTGISSIGWRKWTQHRARQTILPGGLAKPSVHSIAQVLGLGCKQNTSMF